MTGGGVAFGLMAAVSHLHKRLAKEKFRDGGGGLRRFGLSFLLFCPPFPSPFFFSLSSSRQSVWGLSSSFIRPTNMYREVVMGLIGHSSCLGQIRSQWMFLGAMAALPPCGTVTTV